MSILLAGSGPSVLNAPSFVTTAGFFREGYAKCSTDGFSSFSLKEQIADGQNYWVHFVARMVFVSTISSGNGSSNLAFLSNIFGQTCVRVYGAGSGLDGDNVFLAVTNTEGTVGTSVKSIDLGYTVRIIAFDISVENIEGNVLASLFIDNSLVLTASVAGISRGMKQTFFSRQTGAAPDPNISEIIVSTEDTRGLSVRSFSMTADGIHRAWSGTFQDIADTIVLNGRGVSANTINQLISFIPQQVPVGLNIGTVFVNLVAGAAANYGVAIGLRINGNDYFSNNIELARGLLPASTPWLLNPATGLPFSAEDLNSAEIILKSVSV
jgi:hypothetical protein